MRRPSRMRSCPRVHPFCSYLVESDRKIEKAADRELLDVADGRVGTLQPEIPQLREQPLEAHSNLRASEVCTRAIVNAATQRHVIANALAIELYLVRIRECAGIAI